MHSESDRIRLQTQNQKNRLERAAYLGSANYLIEQAQMEMSRGRFHQMGRTSPGNSRPFDVNKFWDTCPGDSDKLGARQQMNYTGFPRNNNFQGQMELRVDSDFGSKNGGLLLNKKYETPRVGSSFRDHTQRFAGFDKLTVIGEDIRASKKRRRINQLDMRINSIQKTSEDEDSGEQQTDQGDDMQFEDLQNLPVNGQERQAGFNQEHQAFGIGAFGLPLEELNGASLRESMSTGLLSQSGARNLVNFKKEKGTMDVKIRFVNSLFQKKGISKNNSQIQSQRLDTPLPNLLFSKTHGEAASEFSWQNKKINPQTQMRNGQGAQHSNPKSKIVSSQVYSKKKVNSWFTKKKATVKTPDQNKPKFNTDDKINSKRGAGTAHQNKQQIFSKQKKMFEGRKIDFKTALNIANFEYLWFKNTEEQNEPLRSNQNSLGFLKSTKAFYRPREASQVIRHFNSDRCESETRQNLDDLTLSKQNQNILIDISKAHGSLTHGENLLKNQNILRDNYPNQNFVTPDGKAKLNMRQIRGDLNIIPFSREERFDDLVQRIQHSQSRIRNLVQCLVKSGRQAYNWDQDQDLDTFARNSLKKKIDLYRQYSQHEQQTPSETVTELRPSRFSFDVQVKSDPSILVSLNTGRPEGEGLDVSIIKKKGVIEASGKIPDSQGKNSSYTFSKIFRELETKNKIKECKSVSRLEKSEDGLTSNIHTKREEEGDLQIQDRTRQFQQVKTNETEELKDGDLHVKSWGEREGFSETISEIVDPKHATMNLEEMGYGPKRNKKKNTFSFSDNNFYIPSPESMTIQREKNRTPTLGRDEIENSVQMEDLELETGLKSHGREEGVFKFRNLAGRLRRIFLLEEILDSSEKFNMMVERASRLRNMFLTREKRNTFQKLVENRQKCEKVVIRVSITQIPENELARNQILKENEIFSQRIMKFKYLMTKYSKKYFEQEKNQIKSILLKAAYHRKNLKNIFEKMRVTLDLQCKLNALIKLKSITLNSESQESKTKESQSNEMEDFVFVLDSEEENYQNIVHQNTELPVETSKFQTEPHISQRDKHSEKHEQIGEPEEPSTELSKKEKTTISRIHKSQSERSDIVLTEGQQFSSGADSQRILIKLMKEKESKNQSQKMGEVVENLEIIRERNLLKQTTEGNEMRRRILTVEIEKKDIIAKPVLNISEFEDNQYGFESNSRNQKRTNQKLQEEREELLKREKKAIKQRLFTYQAKNSLLGTENRRVLIPSYKISRKESKKGQKKKVFEYKVNSLLQNESQDVDQKRSQNEETMLIRQQLRGVKQRSRNKKRRKTTPKNHRARSGKKIQISERNIRRAQQQNLDSQGNRPYQENQSHQYSKNHNSERKKRRSSQKKMAKGSQKRNQYYVNSEYDGSKKVSEKKKFGEVSGEAISITELLTRGSESKHQESEIQKRKPSRSNKKRRKRKSQNHQRQGETNQRDHQVESENIMKAENRAHQKSKKKSRKHSRKKHSSRAKIWNAHDHIPQVDNNAEISMQRFLLQNSEQKPLPNQESEILNHQKTNQSQMQMQRRRSRIPNSHKSSVKSKTHKRREKSKKRTTTRDPHPEIYKSPSQKIREHNEKHNFELHSGYRSPNTKKRECSSSKRLLKTRSGKMSSKIEEINERLTRNTRVQAFERAKKKHFGDGDRRRMVFSLEKKRKGPIGGKNQSIINPPRRRTLNKKERQSSQRKRSQGQMMFQNATPGNGFFRYAKNKQKLKMGSQPAIYSKPQSKIKNSSSVYKELLKNFTFQPKKAGNISSLAQIRSTPRIKDIIAEGVPQFSSKNKIASIQDQNVLRPHIESAQNPRKQVQNKLDFRMKKQIKQLKKHFSKQNLRSSLEPTNVGAQSERVRKSMRRSIKELKSLEQSKVKVKMARHSRAKEMHANKLENDMISLIQEQQMLNKLGVANMNRLHESNGGIIFGNKGSLSSKKKYENYELEKLKEMRNAPQTKFETFRTNKDPGLSSNSSRLNRPVFKDSDIQKITATIQNNDLSDLLRASQVQKSLRTSNVRKTAVLKKMSSNLSLKRLTRKSSRKNMSSRQKQKASQKFSMKKEKEEIPKERVYRAKPDALDSQTRHPLIMAETGSHKSTQKIPGNVIQKGAFNVYAAQREQILCEELQQMIQMKQENVREQMEKNLKKRNSGQFRKRRKRPKFNPNVKKL